MAQTPPRANRGSIILQNPSQNQNNVINRNHGPTHALSAESGMEADTEEEETPSLSQMSQIFPRRTHSRPLRPLPQGFNLSSIPNSDSRNPGSRLGEEALEVPVRESRTREMGTQTDEFAHKGV